MLLILRLLGTWCVEENKNTRAIAKIRKFDVGQILDVAEQDTNSQGKMKKFSSLASICLVSSNHFLGGRDAII